MVTPGASPHDEGFGVRRTWWPPNGIINNKVTERGRKSEPGEERGEGG